MAQGKFIVIDGTDGAGKATQTALLIERLTAAGYNVATTDFPQYGKKSAGLVEEYLNGKYGQVGEVDPRVASMFFAADRFDASFAIKQWLAEGKVVISNRYVTANMGHQGAQITDPAKRQEFIRWLYDLEYGLFKIPRPDLNIILHVSPEISQQLVDAKGHRDYVGGQKRDIHEASVDHLRAAEQTYLAIATAYPGFKLIECVRDGQIMGREEIAELVWQAVQPVLG
ncbi:MAG: thymidylate kinase [Patescibacteria group bacterium]